MNPPKTPAIDLSQFQEVSESPLFGALQTKYYGEGEGGLWVDSWVPMGVCSSTTMADSYARTILAYAEDCKREGLLPPVIVELGAGAGRLSWLILKRMDALVGSQCHDIPYVLTDGSQKIVAQWAQNVLMKPYFDSGRLLSQRFWVGSDTVINLPNGPLHLDTARQRPVVFLGNYLFDSLPCDLVRVRNGKLYRDLVRVNDGEDVSKIPVSEDLFSSLKVDYVSVPVKGDYSPDEDLNAIIERYKNSGRDFCTSVSPSTISFVKDLVAGAAPALLLAGDIGHTSVEGFSERSPLILDSYFAYSVNFDLIAGLFAQKGGIMVTDHTTNSDFTTCAFMHTGTNEIAPDAATYPLKASWTQAHTSLVDNNPADFEHVRDMAEDAAENVDFYQLMMLIRLSKYDPDTALAVMAPLIRLYKQDPTQVDEYVAHTHMLRALENYFPINANSQFDYMVAQFLLTCHMNQQAHDMMVEWRAKLGETPQRCYIMAMAKIRLKALEEGRQYLEKALKLDPSFGPAQRALVDRYQANNDNAADAPYTYMVDVKDPHFHTKACKHFLEDGVVYLKNLYSKELVAALKAQFEGDIKIWEDEKLGDAHNVGHKRVTLPLKVRPPYNDPRVFANPKLIDLLSETMGGAPIVNAYSSVVTYPGAKTQHIHREHPDLFADAEVNMAMPPYAATMLMPLTNLDSRNGGTLVWPGTHKYAGDVPVDQRPEEVFTQAGDALIFDYRVYHGGMACLEAKEPRLMLFIAFSLPWFRDIVSYEQHDPLIIAREDMDKIPGDFADMFKYASIIET